MPDLSPAGDYRRAMRLLNIITAFTG